MPARRDRDDAIAAELERVADALREGEAAVYGYDVEYEPTPSESGRITYPGGWFEFRIERRPDDGDGGGRSHPGSRGTRSGPQE